MQAALQRAALVGWSGQVWRHLPGARRGTVKGGQAKNAPHSTRPKWLRDRVGNACVCRGGPKRCSPLPLLQGRTQNHLLRQGGQGTAEVGQAPPALQETSIARWGVTQSVCPTPSHPEEAPSCSNGGTAAGWLQQEDTAPRGSS